MSKIYDFSNIRAYRVSSAWKKNRKRRLNYDSGKCQGMSVKNGKLTRCLSKIDIEVHHKSYERLGYEFMEDMIVLCRSCHRVEHNRLNKQDKRQLSIDFQEA